MAIVPTHRSIVRHAWAEETGPDGTDFSRPLTKKGRKKDKRTGLPVALRQATAEQSRSR